MLPPQRPPGRATGAPPPAGPSGEVDVVAKLLLGAKVELGVWPDGKIVPEPAVGWPALFILVDRQTKMPIIAAITMTMMIQIVFRICL
jgi:hypothetical protein